MQMLGIPIQSLASSKPNPNQRIKKKTRLWKIPKKRIDKKNSDPLAFPPAYTAMIATTTKN